MNVTEGRERKKTVRGVTIFCSKSLSTYNTMKFQNPEEHRKICVLKIRKFMNKRLCLARTNARKIGVNAVQREILFSIETSQKQDNTKQLSCNRD